MMRKFLILFCLIITGCSPSLQEDQVKESSQSSSAAAKASPVNIPATTRVKPVAAWLVALALLAMLVESALLTRKAMRWRVGHV